VTGQTTRSDAHLLWQQVLALSNRYPNFAARIRPAWWDRPAERELLRALCAWREALDLAIPQAGREVERARLEFEFHEKLQRASDLLATTQARGAFNPDTERGAFAEHLSTLPDDAA
jgi:hypothetical protein